MSARRWLLAGIAGALVVVAASWFLVIGPTRADTADAEAAEADVTTVNTVLASRIAQLEQLDAQRDDLADQVDSALAGLPAGTELPVLSRQVSDQAAARGVVVTGFSVGSPVDATAAGSGTTGASTTEAGTTGSGATGGDASGQTTTPAAVLAIPITVTSTGPATDQLRFLRDLQEVGPRLALVTASSLVAGGDDAETEVASISTDATLTVQMTVFARPLDDTTREQLRGLRGAATTD